MVLVIVIINVLLDISSFGAVTDKEGDPKRSFKIVDGRGLWLPCVVVGEQALRRKVVEGTEAVFFFGKVRRKSFLGPACLWMFPESCFTVVARGKTLPRLEREVKLQ